MSSFKHLRTPAIVCTLLLSACNSPDEGQEATSKQQALTAEEERVLAFEQVSDWQVWSGSGTLGQGTPHSEGNQSLAVSGLGYAGLRNTIPLTKDAHPAPEVVGYDVLIPTNQVNPYWSGDTQLLIDAPSAGIHSQYVGYRSFAGLPKGEFTRVEFPLPDWIRQALNAANYNDLRFVIALNVPPGSATHYLDRFILGPDPGSSECTPVDDGNPCTADDCNPATGQTTHVPLAPGALCSDDNACNGVEACDGAGTCAPGEALIVDDGNACTTDSCDPETGVINIPVAAGTTCQDGDACNGDELCDGAGSCQAGTAPDLDDQNPCTTDSCDPQSGPTHTPAPIGTSCADGDVCNGAETCDAVGSCAAGTPLEVDDENPCTLDSCDATEGVSNMPVAVGTSCDDGNVCNGVSACDGAAACIAGMPPLVDDGNPCTADSCDPLGGVIHANVDAGVACGDGNACNGEELCNGAGSCQAGAGPVLDDGNPCTADACDAHGGVTHTPVAQGVSCADGDACNGAEICNGAGACQAGTPVETDDGNTCTVGSCDPSTGAVTQAPAPADSPCGDGDLCNGSELCDGEGTCAAGTPLDPNDGNACTIDSCDPIFGIENDPAPQGLSCADGDVCNGEEACDGFGACQGGTSPEIDDGNSCTADSCDPVAGVAHEVLDDGTTCSDGDACTTEDSCQSGACVGGAPIVCGALSTCHVEGVCDPATGLCSDPEKPDGSACDDGVACTAGDACEAGACVGGDSPVMEEAPCQIAECDGESGGVVYTQAEEGSTCQLDACTQGVCSAEGECLVTETTVVDDLDPCTVDFCDPILGPVNVACSAIDMTVATTVLSSYSWLFTGDFPVQTGVNPADIEERRAALISGTVTNLAGDALPSVTVTVHGHPEFGRTVTQANGTFQMVVNGGGTMQVQLHKAGYLDSARRVDPKWNQTHKVENVIMIVPDPVVTEISLDDGGEDFQVAQSSVVSDEDGERQGTLLVPPGTVATMRLPDGTEQILDTMHVRITEFTVGPEGPDAMPATLPTNTAYTYAFEANADEAVAAGAPSIEFSEPLVYYVENFIGFPVGETVPVGAYDREAGLWIPHDSGVIIEVLSVVGGIASVDLTGNGVAATPAELDAAGITTGELERLGALYVEDAQLWRVLIPHFTEPYDCNWPFHFPDDATSPSGDGPRSSDPPVSPDCGGGGGAPVAVGSLIHCQTQIFEEEVGVAGSPFSLHYSSQRVPGRVANRIDVPITDATPPASLKRVALNINIAGREFTQAYSDAANQLVSFIWDGMDSAGREVQGRKTASVRVSYVYDGVYGRASRFNDPSLGAQLAGDRARAELYASKEWTVAVGGWESIHTGLGGWSLGVHHAYDAASGQLLRGDGTTQSAELLSATLRRRDAGISPRPRVAGGPDGAIYYCHWRGDHHLRKVAPDGSVSTVAGTGSAGDSGDGGPAINAQVRCNDAPIAVGPDGSIYIGVPHGSVQSANKVRRIDPAGIITTVAGNGVVGSGFSGDGGPATEAGIELLSGIAVSTDGTLYIAEGQGGAATRVRQVGTDGIIKTIYFGGGANGSVRDVAVDPSTGLVYILATGASSNGISVFSLGPDGERRRVFGCSAGNPCRTWDYRDFQAGIAQAPALEANVYGAPSRLGFGPRGELYVMGLIATIQSINAIPFAWRLDPDGMVRPFVGGHPLGASSFPDGSAPEAVRVRPYGIAPLPNGIALSTDSSVYKIAPPLPGLGLDESILPSEDGSEIYQLDGQGRHTRTLHGHTFETLYTFGYDSNGYLSTVEDGNGLVTTIERDAGGNPQAIVAPYGQRTELVVGEDGYLSQISRPGQNHFMTYGTDGLMATFQGPTGETSSMSYDELGRIVANVDREGAPISLDRAEVDDGWSVTRTTAEGREYDYRVELRPDNVQFTENSFPDGTSATNTRNRVGDAFTVRRDGTQVNITLQSDPTFGILTPLSSRVTTLPSGIFRTSTSTKTVNQSDANDPSSLVSFVDTTTVNNLAFTTQFTRNNLRYRSITPRNRITDQFIDQLGRMIELRAPASPIVRTQYDDDKVAAIIIDPDTNPDNGNERVTQMFYDSAGRLTSVLDPLTNETNFGTFDEADRPQAITLPDESEVLMTYDVEGNVATVTPPGKAPHAMTYRSYGRIESYTPPVGNPVQFIYDQDRRMDLIDFGVDALNQPNQVDFEYDNVTGQLSTITSPTGTINVGFENGHMTSLSAPSVSGSIVTSIAYDGFLPTALSWAGPVAGEVNWTYNDRFLIDSETIGALPETTVNYSYDDDGLVTQAGDLAIARDPASGRVLSKTIGNIRESFDYNEFAELSRQTVELMNGSTVVETLYDVVYDDDGVNGDRDALGRITKKTEWIVSGDTPNGDGSPRVLDARTYDYGYNASGRPWLESVAVDGAVVSSYGYDDNGNRTSVELNWSQLGYPAEFDASLSEADTEYDEADKLLTYGTKSYSWNAFGQLSSMTDSATGETTAYEYDLFGNLLSVALPDGRTIEYEVDGAGRRVGRRELDVDGNEISFRGWIYRDLLRPIAEVDAMGNVVARYVYSDGDGARQNGVGQLSTRLGANQDAALGFSGSNVPEAIELLDEFGAVTQTLALSTNQVGSVQLATDAATGDVVQRIEYDEFGRVLSDSSPGHQPFGFAGGLYESETGLARFGARDYSTDVGRWVARDPIRVDSDKENPYLAVKNSPLNYLDVTGFEPTIGDWLCAYGCGYAVGRCLGGGPVGFAMGTAVCVAMCGGGGTGSSCDDDGDEGTSGQDMCTPEPNMSTEPEANHDGQGGASGWGP